MSCTYIWSIPSKILVRGCRIYNMALEFCFCWMDFVYECDIYSLTVPLGAEIQRDGLLHIFGQNRCRWMNSVASMYTGKIYQIWTIIINKYPAKAMKQQIWRYLGENLVGYFCDILCGTWFCSVCGKSKWFCIYLGIGIITSAQNGK